jgi:uncharacterized phiE125 gp8 family phage protein
MSSESHFSLKRTVEPTTDPVSVSEARDHCRIDVSDEDSQVLRWIKAATKYAEERLRRQFITATWRLGLDGWPCRSDDNPLGAIKVPRPPLLAVSSITYVDANGTTQTWDAANYRVDIYSEPGRITPIFGGTWPSARSVVDAIAVTYTSGFGAASAVPSNIKEWILLAVGTCSRQRGLDPETAIKEMEFGWSLLDCESVGDLVAG